MKKRLLIISSLAVLLGLGVAGGLSLAKKETKSAVKVEAAISSVASGTKFYIDMSAFSNWFNDGACIRVNFKGCSSSTYEGWWSDKATEISTDLYCVTVTGTSCTYTKVDVMRCSSDGNTRWNGSGDLNVTSNCVKITDWNTGSMETLYGAQSGDGLYVNYNNVTWWGNDLNTYVYFFNAFDGSAATWSGQAKIVQGTNDKILEVTVPGSGKTYGSCIVVRCATPQRFDGAYNQTVDFYVVNPTSVHNGVVVESSTTDSKNYCSWEYSYNLSSAQRCEMYATYFMDEITCSGSGSVTSTLENWENVEAEYNHIATNVQGDIWLTEASISGTDIEKAMYRYDYIAIYKHYTGYNDFINRSGTSGAAFTAKTSPLAIINKQADTTLLIVIASVLAAAGVGGYFFFRRKKQD